jgi:Peptidase family M23
MTMKIRLMLFALAILVLPTVQAQQCAKREFYHPVTDGDGVRYPFALSPAIWNVLGPIIPVPGTDARIHLAYTIELTNHSSQPMKIKSFQVVDPDRHNERTGTNQVLSIRNEDITGLAQPFTVIPPTLDKRNYTNVLGAGQGSLVFFDVTYDNRANLPAHISHRVTVTETTQDGEIQTYTAIDEPITVRHPDPVVLSPPLKGVRWLDGNGCCKQIGPHRGIISPINGAIQPAEEFAIDFVQLDKNGRGYTGDIKDVKSFPYYGVPVYAAACGTVVEVLRDLPDQVPGANPTSIAIADVAGNHVIEDIGDGRYVMYAHLAPFSATVQVGDFIPKGHVLGKLGNSGNTDSPHLHFQVMDKPSPLGAHGLPFVFDHMYREATYAGTVEAESRQFLAGQPLSLDFSTARHFHDTMPLTFDLLDFKF